MIAIDTNILSRVFVSDDEQQCSKARSFVLSNECFVATSVILEVFWVLAKTYKLARTDLQIAIKDILEASNLNIENSALIERALLLYTQGLDFADAVHLLSAQNCVKFVTFDKKFVKSANGFQSSTQVELL